MSSLDDDIVSLMRKRVYDMSGVLPRVHVYLNDKLLETNSFLKYVDMYFNSTEEVVKIRDDKVDS